MPSSVVPATHLQVFPIPGPHGALLSIGETPEQRALPTVRKQWHEVKAVERMFGLGRNFRGRQAGRGQVHADGDLVRDHARLNAARPPEDLRDAQSSLEQVPFPSDEGPHLGVALAAVVTGEHDERFRGRSAARHP